MSRLGLLALPVAATLLAAVPTDRPATACCPAPPSGKPVVNADQTVILLWDAANKTQHFIRKASFKSDADDFGFLIPSPSQPELAESGNDAFPTLQKLTEPAVIQQKAPSGDGGCGCGYKMAAPAAGGVATPDTVNVLDRKLVAGFNAAVLEATSADALTKWLKDNGYAYSPEIAVWAKPYIEQGWKVTALKVAKGSDAKADKTVAASALRLSFKTDRPLFPYREPDPSSAATQLGATRRLLRIYFLADARYRGELTKDVPWTGTVAWAGKLEAADREKVLGMLGLPATSGPAEWYLTEFEHLWPYEAAPADVYFSPDPRQMDARRQPIVQYVSAASRPDGTAFLIVGALVLLPLVSRWRR
ncbi:MAG TPA: DUF2330 domain-containing protein [Gemmataceae bacterium]|jgi:hypothetical protein|nr:DUF2330 domain-containing protein [Gemmataceae bacterium]